MQNKICINISNFFGYDIKIKMELVIFSGKTHILIGVIVYIALFKFNFLGVLFVVFGSLFPDVDTPFSHIGRRVRLLSCLLKHRGFVHTTFSLIIFSFIVFILFGQYWFEFSFGYLLHLLADTLTPMGIMWKYPFSKKYYSFSKYRWYGYAIILLYLTYIFNKILY